MNDSRLEVIQGDITKLRVDAIVNAANSSLMGGGGVDGAIHRAGGRAILEECKKIIQKQGSCSPGRAVITGGGNLPARFVIHTVGPVWHGGHSNERNILADCYTHSLRLALDNGIKSIAFPGISTGIYGFPKDQAAPVAVKTVRSFLSKNKGIEKVIFVCFDEESFELIQKEIKAVSGK